MKQRISICLYVFLAIIALILNACGSDGYTWYTDAPPATSYVWYHEATEDDVREQCGWPPKQPGGGTLYGCAWPNPGGVCTVYSIYSEDQAKIKKINGVSHFDHEVGDLQNPGKTGHCAGKRHREIHVRGT